MANKEVVRFLQIFKNVCRMLEARDYFSAHDWTQEDLDGFVKKVGPTLEDIELYAIVGTKIGNDDDKICVFFPQSRINKSVHTELRERAKKLGCSSIILCSRSDVTGATRQMMNADPDFHVEYFMDWKFLVNLPDHDMVPRHVVLSGECCSPSLRKHTVESLPAPANSLPCKLPFC